MEVLPILFHHTHDQNVRLSKDKRRADRIEGFNYGICFSDKPVKCDQRVYIKVSKVSTEFMGGVCFGFTSDDPATLHSAQLPESVFPALTTKPGYWGKGPSRDSASLGDILFFYVTTGGDVMYGINGEDKGVYLEGVSTNTPLWALIDMYGECSSVDFLGLTSEIGRFGNCAMESNAILKHTGKGVSQIMGSKPVENRSSFTVEIISCGTEGAIGIGIASAAIPKDICPGSVEDSIGYHSDDGGLYYGAHTESKVKEYVCKKGDTLQCSIEKKKSFFNITFNITFLKNGTKVYSKSLPPAMSKKQLYPLISMRAVGDAIKINSGPPVEDTVCSYQQLEADTQTCAGLHQMKIGQQISHASTTQDLIDDGSCLYNAICSRFQAHLKIPAAYMDSRYDLCYCDTCETKRGDGLYYKRGQPPQLYATPTEWCRFGLKIPPKAEEQDVFNKWHVGYHGTQADNLIKILRSGDLLMPGDHTLDGGILKPPSGHFDEDCKPSGFDIQQVFLSPTIRYAGMNVYAKQQRWKDPNTGISYTTKVAFQLRIKPSSYEVGRETVLPKGLDVRIDPKFKNSELEWSTKRRGATIVTGLLLHVEEC